MPALSHLPQIVLGHYPTPIESLSRLSTHFPGCQISVKRDDCTGLGFGGNKVRQIEFYLGDALSKGCDTVLSTGAIQSNYMRTIAAAASKLGLDCHIQLENRVKNTSKEYQTSGNRLLTDMFGAQVSYYPEGEDEDGADRSINEIAEQLKAKGKTPYVIPLSMVKEPKGAFGYMVAAQEMLQQFESSGVYPEVIVVGSGSGLTHAGLLMGLRLLGSSIPVLGACVRRQANLQKTRIKTHCENLSRMLEVSGLISDEDIWVNDNALAPGYGQISDALKKVIGMAATNEGLLLDPVYSGKTLCCLLNAIEADQLNGYQDALFVHTGGTPAIFAYQNELSDL